MVVECITEDIFQESSITFPCTFWEQEVALRRSQNSRRGIKFVFVRRISDLGVLYLLTNLTIEEFTRKVFYPSSDTHNTFADFLARWLCNCPAYHSSYLSK